MEPQGGKQRVRPSKQRVRPSEQGGAWPKPSLSREYRNSRSDRRREPDYSDESPSDSASPDEAQIGKQKPNKANRLPSSGRLTPIQTTISDDRSQGSEFHLNSHILCALERTTTDDKSGKPVKPRDFAEYSYSKYGEYIPTREDKGTYIYKNDGYVNV